MSTILTAITNSNTFGQWKDRTNQIITALNGVVTIGDAETNAGNVVITGNVTSTGTLYINTIDATSSNTNNLITVNADLRVAGNLQVSSSAAAEIKLYNSAVSTWTLGTNADHTQFDIKKGTSRLRFDEAQKLITATDLKLDSSLFPESLSGINTSGTAAKADEWTTGRTITLTGDVTGTSTEWTGNGNISFEATVADNSHSHEAANITDLSTTLDTKVDVSGDTMTGDLKMGVDKSVQLGTVAGSTTSIKRGTFGPAVGTPGHVADAFSITTTGANVSTYISLPGTGSSLYITDGNTLKASVAANGDIVTIGDITAFGQISDITRKENVVRISNALDKIKQVSGYTYNYIGNATPMTGVVAQEFETVLPEVVYNTVMLDGTVSKAVRHGNIVGLLIEAIKELEAQIAELRKGK